MRIFGRRRKKEPLPDDRNKQTFWKGCYTPTYNHEEKLWGVEDYLGIHTGDITYICYMACGMTMTFPYSYGEGNRDYAENFEQVLNALLRYPEEFSIQGFESKYSEQERQLLGALQEALLQIQKTGRPLSRAEMTELNAKYRPAPDPPSC